MTYTVSSGTLNSTIPYHAGGAGGLITRTDIPVIRYNTYGILAGETIKSPNSFMRHSLYIYKYHTLTLVHHKPNLLHQVEIFLTSFENRVFNSTNNNIYFRPKGIA